MDNLVLSKALDRQDKGEFIRLTCILTTLSRICLEAQNW